MALNKDKIYLTNIAAKNTMAGAIGELVKRHIDAIGPSMLVKVIRSYQQDASIAGMVDVLPLVKQQDALGRSISRPKVYSVPYLRIQGGASAVIVDPSPGDIGFIVVAGRDMKHVIATRDEAPPASYRKNYISDCVYVGGFLNDAPTQFIQATDKGWRIVTPGDVTIEAQGNVNIKAASVTANCDISTSGDVKAGGISLKNHTHGGVQSGGSRTSTPE